MMKKILACLLIGIMIFALASCEPKNKEEETTTKAPEETTTKAPEETTTPPPSDDNDDDDNLPEDTTITYTVTVVDENNAPLAGAVVQLCVGELCRLPVLTGANGVATLNVDEDNYTVKVTLTGYTGEASYSFPAGSTALTVQLTKIAGDDNNNDDNNGGNVGGDNGDNGDNGNNGNNGNNNDNTGDNNNNNDNTGDNNNNNDNTGDNNNNNNNNNSTSGELEMPEIPI